MLPALLLLLLFLEDPRLTWGLDREQREEGGGGHSDKGRGGRGGPGLKQGKIQFEGNTPLQ